MRTDVDFVQHVPKIPGAQDALAAGAARCSILTIPESLEARHHRELSLTVDKEKHTGGSSARTQWL